jgi:3-oxoacyl-[acyl-carrier-protein] synthase-3
MGSKIAAVSYFLPETILSNEQLNAEFPEWSVGKIAGKTGILNRHIVAESECSSDLAVAAGRKMFSEHNVSPSDIDFILLCTQSPDYFLPTTACLVQKELLIPTRAGALDFNLGCSGYVYGLSLAKGLIATGAAKNVLFITTDTYSKYIHPQDKSVRSIFGDAATATLITGDDDEQIGNFVFGTDGNGAENLIVRSGGSRYPVNADSKLREYADANGNVRSDSCLYMNGSEIFAFTLKAIPSLCHEVLARNGLALEEVDYFVFHQANKYMLNALRKKLNIDENKFCISLQDSGNTVSSTIPIALQDSIKNKRIKKGNKVMMLGFGVGYSWAGTIIRIGAA